MNDTSSPSPDPLDDLERDVAALVPEEELYATVEELAAIGAEGGERAIRYAILRGIVENRNGFFESALTTLHKAREAAIESDAGAHLARISRERARVYTWRGDGRSAALELLRSLVEAEAAGNTADAAAALAEVGRLNLEVGRYDAALGALDRAARLAPGVLDDREPGRIAANRCEALLALRRAEECVAVADAALPLLLPKHRREQFVVRVVKARALLRLGRDREAAEVAAEAEGYRSPNPSSYEHSEWRLLEGLLKRTGDRKAAIAALEEALQRFRDEELARHEVETRIHLAQLLVADDRRAEAETCMAEALTRCDARQLHAMGDRARAAAMEFWSADRIADLSGENVIKPGESGGRFLVIEKLGSGGFGSVERAIDENTGDEVAIKSMRADALLAGADAASVVETIRNEVKAAGKVANRSYVARTRYINVERSGAVVLVQDFVRGPTLRKILNDGTHDRARRYAIAANLARAIAGIHARDVAHRDLKPENVILRDGRDPVLIDLGLARFSGSPDLLSGMGTPPYAAPEQWQETMDPRYIGREDIYALAIIIGELAGDELPSKTEPPGKLAAFFSLRPRRSNLNRRLVKLTQAMLVENPAERTVDLHEVAAALDEAAAEAAEARR